MKVTVRGNQPSDKKRVQATNDDSIVSKRSSSRCGYFSDDFLRHFVEKPSKRSPLINRGYYIRCAAVRRLLRQFLQENTGCSKQIVSLGAGFDTSFFVLHDEFAKDEQGKRNVLNLRYFELDFDGVVQRKSQMVAAERDLNRFIENMKTSESDIIGDNYALLATDLRDVTMVNNALKKAKVSNDVPTLFFAECVLTYIDSTHSSNLISWAAKNFPCSCFVTYEQILPDDAFGVVMCNNLAERGSPLLGIAQFPTVESQRQRYLDLGFTSCQAVDLNTFWMDILERDQVWKADKLEVFDEEEEWKTKCAHYFVSCAYKDDNNTGFFLNTAIPTSLSVPVKPLVPSQNLMDFTSKVFPNMSWSKNADPVGKKGNAPRWGHSTCLLTSHQLVVFGGYGGGKSHARLNDVLILDTSTLKWSEPLVTGTAPSARLFHSSFLYNDAMFILGGRAGPDAPLNDMFSLDKSMKWSKVVFNNDSQDLPRGRWRHTTTVIGNKVFLFGGRDKTDTFNDLYVLNLQTMVWTRIEHSGDIPTPRYSHSAVAYKDKVIVFGGIANSLTLLNDVYVLDSNTFTWTRIQTQSPPSSRFAHSSTVVDDYVIVIGGCSPNALNDVHVLDLNSFTWNSVNLQTPPQTIFCKHTATLVNHEGSNRIFLVGGGVLCFSFGSLFSPLNVLLLDGKELSKPDKLEVDQVIVNNNNNQEQKVPKKRKKKTGQVPRYDNPDAELFLELTNKRSPFIMTNVNIGRANPQVWTPEYLIAAHGDKEVSVHVGAYSQMDFINKNYVFKNMSFAELVQKIYGDPDEKYYLRSIGENARKDVSDVWQGFPKLVADFEVPKCVPTAHPNHKQYFSSAFRMSSKGMQMWTHYDIMDNILCEISGSKKVVLWSPSEVNHLYVSGSTSRVLDIESPDFKKFPKFAKARSVECVLAPGEILFIPALWFHNVLALDPCVAINIFWKHLPEEFYEKKDLYGNKDLVAGTKAMKEAETVCKTLSQLPQPYREFYARKILENIKSNSFG